MLIIIQDIKQTVEQILKTTGFDDCLATLRVPLFGDDTQYSITITSDKNQHIIHVTEDNCDKLYKRLQFELEMLNE